MKEYLSKIRLEVNGKEVTDFQNFKEGKRELRKAVNLMNHTGTTPVTPRLTVSLDYVIPKGEAEFNFEDVVNGTITVDHNDGTRITFTGATFLDSGEATFNGDKEATRAINFHVDARKE
jgi:hypothetical protein